jgi:hypothetical protein
MRTMIWAVALTATALAIRSGVLNAQGAELSGEVALETRLFPRAPLYAGQSNARFSPSVRFTPEFVYEWKNGIWRLAAIGFIRIDANDSRRTHADLREFGLLYLGNSVTAFAGFGKVFWGVTEVHHLVDIVNQTDAVEDVDNEDKLGQPMLNVTLEGGWGYMDVFYLPMFRERTYPAANARLRGLLPISDDPSYQSEAGRFHQDFAFRWYRPFGAFDVGASFFRGTSREPRFVVVADAGGSPYLKPHYDLIDQFGIDAQWTGSATLLKLEAITRGGHGDRFFAATGGLEYTLYQLFGGSSDVGLLAEFMLDGRGVGAPPTVFDNDVFFGFRWALNDVHDTAILGGPVIDYKTGEIVALLEAERRLGAGWRFEFEARLFANTTPGAVASGLRRDGFVTLRLSRFF